MRVMAEPRTSLVLMRTILGRAPSLGTEGGSDEGDRFQQVGHRVEHLRHV